MANPALYNTIATAFRNATTHTELRNDTFQSARLLIEKYFTRPDFETSEAGPLEPAIFVPNQAAILAEDTCVFVARPSNDTGLSDVVLLAVNADSSDPGIFDTIQPKQREVIAAEIGGPAFGIMIVRNKIVYVSPDGQRMGVPM